MERNIKLIALFNFFTDFKFYSAVLVIYFAKVTGSFTLAMSLFSVTMISSSLFEIPTGVFSDKIGRKKTVVLGAISALIYAILYALGTGYWILFLGAIFEGLSRAFYSGNNDALLYDSLAESNQKEKFDHYLGKLSAMFQAALTIGAVIGSFIAAWSFPLLMWLSVIPQVICLIISLFIRETKPHLHESNNIYNHIFTSAKILWGNKKLRLLALNSILGFGIGEATFEFNSAFIATVWPTWAIGISKMISYIGGGLSFWYSGKLIKKFKGLNLMLFDAIWNRFANSIAVLLPGIFSPIIMSSTSFLYGVTQVAGNTLMQKEFTDSQRATLASITSLIGSIVFGIYSIILGLVADSYSPAIAILVSQICSIPRIYFLKMIYNHDSNTKI
jgi:MFS family permease